MISPNHQNAQEKKLGRSSNEWSKYDNNFFVMDCESTITTSMFVRIFVMTIFWKSCSHSTSNCNDLAEIWALCQKITAHEARLPLKFSMNP
jgi:hypothetical protein